MRLLLLLLFRIVLNVGGFMPLLHGRSNLIIRKNPNIGLQSYSEDCGVINQSKVWILGNNIEDEEGNQQSDASKDKIQWNPAARSPGISRQATPVDETWQWCQDFVVPLNLCPWAAASVTTTGAIEFYMVPSSVSPQQLVAITENVAERFVNTMETSTKDISKVAIFFIILTSNADWCESFTKFYDWFLQLEDDWIDQGIDTEDDDSIYNLVTLAAFHPDWQFGGSTAATNGDGALDYEKKSPYPTLTLVWTDTIDAAGPEATERIAQHNQQVLVEEMALEKVKAFYSQAVWGEGKQPRQHK